MVLQSSPIEWLGKQSKVRASTELCALQLSTHLTLTTTLGGRHYCFLCQWENLDKLDFLVQCLIHCMVFGAKCCSPLAGADGWAQGFSEVRKGRSAPLSQDCIQRKEENLVKVND